MPLWFANLVSWSAQAAIVGLMAGLLLRLFPIRNPRVLLAFFRGLLLFTLALPVLQPWHRLSSVILVPTSTDNFVERSVAAVPVVEHW